MYRGTGWDSVPETLLSGSRAPAATSIAVPRTGTRAAVPGKGVRLAHQHGRPELSCVRPSSAGAPAARRVSSGRIGRTSASAAPMPSSQALV